MHNLCIQNPIPIPLQSSAKSTVNSIYAQFHSWCVVIVTTPRKKKISVSDTVPSIFMTCRIVVHERWDTFSST